jgi:hypothetical protein
MAKKHRDSNKSKYPAPRKRIKRRRGGQRGNQNARKYEQVRVTPLHVDYDISKKAGVLKLYRDVLNWTLKGDLDARRAGALAHLLDGYRNALVPSDVDDRLDDLEKQAQAARKALADRIGLEVTNPSNTSKSAEGSGSG